MAGLFITFEGGEGGGKTSQINRLAEFLKSERIKTITTREPGGTAQAEKIRDLIVQRGAGEWNALSECLLVQAARVEHWEEVIKPNLDRKKVVVSDRFFDSTIAYQGYGRGLDLQKIENIFELTLKDAKPDITFLLDIDPAEGLKRSKRRLGSENLGIAQSEDRFEAEELSFHERVRQGFLDRAEKDKERFVVLDASQSQDILAEHIQKIVLDRLPDDLNRL